MKSLRETLACLDEGEWDNISVLKERTAEFLLKFGFISGEEAGWDKGLSVGLQRFQEFHAVEETGKADPVTRSLMKKARCGNFRYERNLIAKDRNSEDLYEKSGLCFWSFGEGDRKLMYGFDSNVKLQQHESLCDQVRNALAVWASHCQIQLIEATSIAGVDISIDWRQADDPDFSLLGSEAIAHADYPGKCGQFGVPKPIHFDVEEHQWNPGGFNLWNVALHEMGHILGFRDSNDPASVMYHSFEENEANRAFSLVDLELLYMLYPKIV